MLDYKKEEFLPYHQFTISLQFAFVGQCSVHLDPPHSQQQQSIQEFLRGGKSRR